LIVRRTKAAIVVRRDKVVVTQRTIMLRRTKSVVRCDMNVVAFLPQRRVDATALCIAPSWRWLVVQAQHRCCFQA
jgi:hypothetical protein